MAKCILDNQVEVGSTMSKSISDLIAILPPSSSSSDSSSLDTLRQQKLITENEDDEKPRLNTTNSANFVHQVLLKTSDNINRQLGLNKDAQFEVNDHKLKPAQRWKKIEERLQELRAQKKKINASWEIQCQ